MLRQASGLSAITKKTLGGKETPAAPRQEEKTSNIQGIRSKQNMGVFLAAFAGFCVGISRAPQQWMNSFVQRNQFLFGFVL